MCGVLAVPWSRPRPPGVTPGFTALCQLPAPTDFLFKGSLAQGCVHRSHTHTHALLLLASGRKIFFLILSYEMVLTYIPRAYKELN